MPIINNYPFMIMLEGEVLEKVLSYTYRSELLKKQTL